MEIIRKEDLDFALSQEYRQYLTGRLGRPQPFLRHIEDDIEVGMSLYESFTADKPHVHPVCTEHGLVLSGTLRIRELETGEETEFHEGDFFVLRPGTPYASKSLGGTRVLFIKHPGQNDKTLVEPDEETIKWMRKWDSETE